jgi:hypothetical protein
MQKNIKTARKQFSEWVSLTTTRTSSTSALTSLAYPDEETTQRSLKMRAKRRESRKHIFSRHREGKINFLKLRQNHLFADLSDLTSDVKLMKIGCKCSEGKIPRLIAQLPSYKTWQLVTAIYHPLARNSFSAV